MFPDAEGSILSCLMIHIHERDGGDRFDPFLPIRIVRHPESPPLGAPITAGVITRPEILTGAFVIARVRRGVVSNQGVKNDVCV